MGPRLLIMILCGTLLAGCIDPNTTPGADEASAAPAPANLWKPHRCDPNRDRGVAHDAPWIDSWQGTPEELARRFAYALREPLPDLDAAKSEGRYWYWESDDVHIRLTMGDPEIDPNGHELSYFTPKQWPGKDETSGRRTMNDFIARFGVPSHVALDLEVDDDGNAEVRQQFQGQGIGPASSGAVGDGSGRFGWWSGFHWRPLHDLREVRVEVSSAQAVATARTYLDCVMEAEGKTQDAGYRFAHSDEMTLDLVGASLVRRVHITYTQPDPPGHCGFGRVVNVDARTGAVHGWEHAPCD